MDPQVWLTIGAALGGGAVGSVITAWVSRRNSRDSTRAALEANEIARSNSNRDFLFKALERTNSETHPDHDVIAAHGAIRGMLALADLSDADRMAVEAAVMATAGPALEAGRRILRAGGKPDYVIEEDE